MLRAMFGMLANLFFAVGVFGLVIMILIVGVIVGSFFFLSGILKMLF